MYKPPTNTNRVKTIKNKFEQYEAEAKNEKSPVEKLSIAPKYTARSHLSPVKLDPVKSNLSRQHSDPLKRNIKRTPAFRLDKSVENATPFQRNTYANRSTTFENKVKQFNSALKNNCDSNSNVITSDKCANVDKECKKTKLVVSDQRMKPGTTVNSNMTNKPMLFKSKSSADFKYIRSKFCNNNENDETAFVNDTVIYQNHQSNLMEAKSVEKLDKLIQNKVDLSLLYTEPIPKALRKKNCDIETVMQKHDIYSISTLKLSDKNDSDVTNINHIGLTDTLKSALKRPLPVGPAPKKPPRTFQHAANQNNFESNNSFLHSPKPKSDIKLNIKPKSPTKKADPKYMLTKLENALKNNKLRARKNAKMELSTTSGEDSDDSLLFKSKSQRSLPKLPVVDQPGTTGKNSVFDFNCFTNTTYEKPKEPMSSFFVDRAQEEPVYAEPFHHRNGDDEKENNQVKRNSLYYMSSPVCVAHEEQEFPIEGSSSYKDSGHLPNSPMKIQLDLSSMSSFTSDTDSICSTSNEDSSPSRVREIVTIFQQQENVDRVETLRNTLNRTLERRFSNSNTNVKDLVQKFQHYNRQVPKYCEPKFNKTDPLFLCCLIVERSQDVVKVKYKFPAEVDVPTDIEKLIFPETHMPTVDSSCSAQCYSMVLTDEKAERTYGYCRRVIPEGTTTCLPLAYCILSKHRSPRFYKKVLEELESRHGYPDKIRDELIGQFYMQTYPLPGQSIAVDLTYILNPSQGKTGEYGSITRKGDRVFVNEDDFNRNVMNPRLICENSDCTLLELTLHPDIRYEVTDLSSLHKLPSSIILSIFSSLLLERKVVLISSVLSDLSLTVEALQSVLYPFVWPHTVIPVVPECVWTIVESPTPVICGCLSKDVLSEHRIENGIVVDLDKNNVLRSEGDEDKILSNSMKKIWRKNLNLANSKKVNSERLGESAEYNRSKYLRDAYLNVFLLCMSHYKNHLKGDTFDRDKFVKNGKTKGIRKFLEMFTQTTMFNEFLKTASEGVSDFDKMILSNK
ncbi:DENN domain-containing protein 2B isoform X2 [Aethina tumida]|uniref:DENN domain-containing protein 2B isoform X2 n=1 Tax=Aethina tumida TaxID=116153 RepID=UPI0021484B76|nr:DENN domain-containing protein 2B isoform X2 [Aethina tumida]